MPVSHHKLAVIGGDARFIALADSLGSRGFEVALCGIDPPAHLPPLTPLSTAVTRCPTPESAIGGAAALILPLPYSVDRLRVNCPLGGYDIRLDALFSMLKPGQAVIGGRLDEPVFHLAERAGVTLDDYYACEELAVANSVPTAEGAVEVAMRELSITLFDARVLVYGYGKVGKTLASLLHAMGARVTVAARRREERARARIAGMDAIDPATPPIGRCDVVFNTVPAPIITRPILEALGRDCVIIELASKPGGVDSEAAAACGVKVIWALSLPGKVAPVSAGRAMADCIVHLLGERGIVTESKAERGERSCGD